MFYTHWLTPTFDISVLFISGLSPGGFMMDWMINNKRFNLFYQTWLLLLLFNQSISPPPAKVPIIYRLYIIAFYLCDLYTSFHHPDAMLILIGDWYGLGDAVTGYIMYITRGVKDSQADRLCVFIKEVLGGGGGEIRLIACIVGFQPLMVISPTASWIRWCTQVYACVRRMLMTCQMNDDECLRAMYKSIIKLLLLLLLLPLLLPLPLLLLHAVCK